MKTTKRVELLFSTFFAAVLFVVWSATNISSAASSSDAHDEFPNVSVQELATMIASGDATPVDANNKWFREKHGVIPNAKLLSSYRNFDLAELPSNKESKLVFYCSNTLCTAAPIAAKLAQQAGYKDVNVLPVGLSGWKQAGQKVDPI